MTYVKTREIFQVIIRVLKNDSAFVYFNLESNDNLFFYSTLDEGLGTPYRNLEINTTIEFKENLEQLLKHFTQQIKLETLSQKIVKDIAKD